tara:strand:- start:228 stop:332 length:105 start_codon:yes stop_codon:yes gene_type:complete
MIELLVLLFVFLIWKTLSGFRFLEGTPWDKGDKK